MDTTRGYTEFCVAETARRLRECGHPISCSRLAVLVTEGRGPPHRDGNRLVGRGRERLIRWQDAIEWASARREGYETRIEFPPLLPPPPTDREMLADQILHYLRVTHPDKWRDLLQQYGPDRRHLLRQIGEAAISLAESFFNGIEQVDAVLPL